LRLTRCIEDDPGLAGLEQWMRSLGDGWETVLVAQQKAMFPYLCWWEREAFCVRLGFQCTMWSATHDDCTPLRLRGPLEVMVRQACPYLCTGWEVFATATYDGKATLGLCWVKP